MNEFERLGGLFGFGVFMLPHEVTKMHRLSFFRYRAGPPRTFDCARNCISDVSIVALAHKRKRPETGFYAQE